VNGARHPDYQRNVQLIVVQVEIMKLIVVVEKALAVVRGDYEH
jgi:hypothetical protein